ncbi:MAG: hypothetical protein H6703_16850 [Myxococcales bacterium]|nr:hypothetical protein [Myxococcales bacterium]
MFIATMYSYGDDLQAVGVDGIRGCLGIFLDTGARLYAIHIPDTPANFAAGRLAFAAHVNGVEPHFNRGTARLYAVMNGPNRPGVYREVLDYAQALGGVRRFMTVRVNEHLGPKGFNQDSVSIVLERIPHTTTARLKYQRNADVPWQHGIGTARAGFYYNGGYNDVLSASLAPVHGWHMVDPTNSTIALTNW